MEIDKRPWGEYKVIEEGKRYKVKLITMLPKKRFSLQRHKLREEHWTFVEGQGKITLGDKMFNVVEGDTIHIPVEEIHRLENTEDIELKFIEVQYGTKLVEEDIERIEDDFGRK